MATGVDLGTVRRILAGAVTPDSLDAACRVAADTLGVAGLAVTVALPRTVRAVIGASTRDSRLLEEAQLTVAEGPCTVATVTGRPVRSGDLRDPTETRWPMLVRYLTDVPVRAVLALPLIPVATMRGARALGSMDCSSPRPNGLDDVDVPAMGELAGLIADAVPRLRTPHPSARDPVRGTWAQLHRATALVESALGLSALDALDALRGRAFASGLLLNDLAADVVSGRSGADLTDPPATSAGAVAG